MGAVGYGGDGSQVKGITIAHNLDIPPHRAAPPPPWQPASAILHPPQDQGTCVSVSISDVATSKRLGLDRYLLSLNWFSSSRSCWLVKAVRGRRHFPIKPDCGAAAGQTAGRGQGTVGLGTEGDIPS